MTTPYVQGRSPAATSSRLPRKRIITASTRPSWQLIIESTQVVTIARDPDGFVRVEVREYEEERIL